MFKILDNKTICLTCGDIADIVVAAKSQNGEPDTLTWGYLDRGGIAAVRIA